MEYDITNINIDIGCGSCENLKLKGEKLFCDEVEETVTTLKKAVETLKGIVIPKNNCPKDDKVNAIKKIRKNLNPVNHGLAELKDLKSSIESTAKKTKHNVIIEDIYDGNLSTRLASFLKENNLKVSFYYVNGQSDKNLKIKCMDKYNILAYNSKEDISKLIQKGNIVEFEINGNISKELYKDNKS